MSDEPESAQDPKDDAPPALPPEALADPVTKDLEGVHRLVADRIVEHWREGTDIFKLLTRHRSRIYYPRHIRTVVEKYAKHVDSGANFALAGEQAFKSELVDLARFTRIAKVATGKELDPTVYNVRSGKRLLDRTILPAMTKAKAFSQKELKRLWEEANED